MSQDKIKLLKNSFKAQKDSSATIHLLESLAIQEQTLIKAVQDLYYEGEKIDNSLALALMQKSAGLRQTREYIERMSN